MFCIIITLLALKAEKIGYTLLRWHCYIVHCMIKMITSAHEISAPLHVFTSFLFTYSYI